MLSAIARDSLNFIPCSPLNCFEFLLLDAAFATLSLSQTLALPAIKKTQKPSRPRQQIPGTSRTEPAYLPTTTPTVEVCV